MRLLNLIVAAALVLAAAYVYKIKVAATVEAERVAKQVGGRVLSNATNTLVREVMRGIFGNVRRR